MAFSPDGRVLATAHDDQSVRLWDVSDPVNPLAFGQLLTGHSGYVNSVAFGPNGRLLATASSDQTIRLWDVAAPVDATPLGEPLTRYASIGHFVAFSRDGQFLSSASGNTVGLWDLNGAHAFQRICAATRGVLTPERWQHHIPQLSYEPPCR